MNMNHSLSICVQKRVATQKEADADHLEVGTPNTAGT